MSTEDSKPTPPAVDKKKKANSYYYWHGHEKERAAVGDVAPLPTPVLVKKEDAPAGNSSSAAVVRKSVVKYAWSDGEKFVTVYIDSWVSGAGSDAEEVLQEDSLKVEFNKQSLLVHYDASCKGNKVSREFSILILNKKIDPEKSSYRVKLIEKENEPLRRQILVKLAKTKNGSWFELTGKKMEADSDEEKNNEEEKDSDDEE